MISTSTTSWGCRVISANKLNFYHKSLPRVSISQIIRIAGTAKEIALERDGTITITVEKASDMNDILLSIIPFLNKKLKEDSYPTTYYYKMKDSTRKILMDWALAFEGCLALILINDETVKKYTRGEWNFFNSSVGGIHIPPFTLLFHKDHPRVVNPAKFINRDGQPIEKRAAFIIRKIVRRIEESQKGYEGLALISLVENMTDLKASAISEIIYDKSFGIKTPKFSPLFNPHARAFEDGMTPFSTIVDAPKKVGYTEDKLRNYNEKFQEEVISKTSFINSYKILTLGKMVKENIPTYLRMREIWIGLFLAVLVLGVGVKTISDFIFRGFEVTRDLTTVNKPKLTPELIPAISTVSGELEPAKGEKKKTISPTVSPTEITTPTSTKEATKVAALTSTPDDIVVIAQKDDNFWKIAKRVCGNGRYNLSIQRYNGYGKKRALQPGDTIEVICSF